MIYRSGLHISSRPSRNYCIDIGIDSVYIQLSTWRVGCIRMWMCHNKQIWKTARNMTLNHWTVWHCDNVTYPCQWQCDKPTTEWEATLLPQPTSWPPIRRPPYAQVAIPRTHHHQNEGEGAKLLTESRNTKTLCQQFLVSRNPTITHSNTCTNIPVYKSKRPKLN